MKILIVTENFKYGGLETNLLDFAFFGKKNGHEIFFVVGSNDRKEFLEKQFGVNNVLYVNMSLNNNDETCGNLVDKIVNYASESGVDFFCLHPFSSFVLGSIAASICGKPFSMTLHGPASLVYDKNPIYLTYLKFISGNAKVFQSVSYEVVEMLMDLGFDIVPVVHPNGVNIHKYDDLQCERNNRIAIVSRLDSDKVVGIKNFLSKLNVLNEKYQKDVDIFGYGNSYNELAAWCNTNSFNFKIYFKGHSDSLGGEMGEYFLVAGMGRVALEACSKNVPVILLGYYGAVDLLDLNNFEAYSNYNFSGRYAKILTIKALENKLHNLEAKEDVPMLRDHVAKYFNSEIICRDQFREMEKEVSFDGKSDQFEFFIKMLMNEKFSDLYNIETFKRILLSRNDMFFLNILLDSAINNFQISQKKIKIKNELIRSKDNLKKLTIDNLTLKSSIIFLESSKFWKLRTIYIKLVRNFSITSFFKKILKGIIDIFKPFVPLYLRRKFGATYNMLLLKNTHTERCFSVREIEKFNNYIEKKNILGFNFKLKNNKSDKKESLLSIIIVTFNNIQYTKACINSIVFNNDYSNYEVIIVDNNSTDGTKQYLLEVKKRYKNFFVVLNDKNKGFAGGNNDGLSKAKGEYIVLLNNDTIVTKTCFSAMVNILSSEKSIGMIGPVSNSVGNAQMIPVEYTKLKNIQSWSEKYVQKQKEFYSGIEMLGFFCVMMKREVFDKVGLLDENFGIGMFEDDDYCIRVKNEGYALVFTHKAFVHHFGSASFKKINDEVFKKNWKKNQEYFEKKWKIKWKSYI